MVNLNTMVAQFATLDQSTQPLSMNTLLLDAARFHSNDMFTNAFQDHTGSDGRGTFDRIDDFGYSGGGGRAENIFAFGDSVEHGHAGLDIDWGTSATGQSIDGMQDPPGHRTNIHGADFREVGLGIVVGTNTVGGSTVGPFVITEDFGSQPGSGPFITGVAFYDLNGNEFYDVGEGLGGIAVDVSGAASSAVTAQSGGFSVPVAGNGTYTVTFSGPNLAEEMGTVEVANDENAGIDYLPAYSAPTVSPPAEIFVNFANGFTFTSVGGATGYRLRQALLANEDFSENAESDADVTIEPVDPGYSVIQGSVVPPGGGSNAFHLANPNFTDTTITLDASILIQASSQLEFLSRLGVATANQIARVQTSTDEGTSWQDIFTQAGASQPGETSFVQRSVSLSSFEGGVIRIRLIYDFTGGTAFTGTDIGTGWYVDNISITNSQQLTGVTETDLTTSTTFFFSPSTVGSHLVQVQARNVERLFPFGPASIVEAQVGSAGAESLLLSGMADLVNDGTLFQGFVYNGFEIRSSEAIFSSVPGTITRISFLDPGGDLMFAEYGSDEPSTTLTISLENFQAAVPSPYNQPGTTYAQGLPTFTIENPTPLTFFSTFTLGNDVNRVDVSLINSQTFSGDVDGIADVRLIRVVAPVGQQADIGGINAANGKFAASSGVIGVDADDIRVGLFLFVGNLRPSGTAVPRIRISPDSTISEILINGGDLADATGAFQIDTNDLVYPFPFRATDGQRSISDISLRPDLGDGRLEPVTDTFAADPDAYFVTDGQTVVVDE